MMNQPNFAFFGHHKCASTSISHLCFDLANDIGFQTIYKKTAFHPEVFKLMNAGKHNFLISLNSKYEGVDQMNCLRGFHVIRDPRDICVSGYFSHRYSHSEDGFDRLKPHRKALKKLSLEEGLLKEFEFSKFWIDHIESWNYHDERILELKIEEIMLNPYDSWLKIFSWLSVTEADDSFLFPVKAFANRALNRMGLSEHKLQQSIPKKRAEALIEKYSFKNLAKGRKQGNEDQKSHYRKGTPGDWKNYFNDEHKSRFKELYGSLIVELGYEKDHEW
jgi:hypothetical protein